jgi:GH25 family lysozyme M1 (1,4-beta-N-acetylmuramidase)
MKCIDVSCWQKGIDFAKVKAAGISAVIIRAGYGCETSQKDSQFEAHYKGAKAAGLKIGAYWYSYASSVAEAKVEAQTCLACIKDKSFDIPIYFDMEESYQTKLGKTVITNMAIAFCDTINASGFKAGVYSNLNWFNNYLNYSTLKAKYSIWLAQWANSHTLACDIWQYSETGSVTGVCGNVDMNIIENTAVISSGSSNTASNTVTQTAAPDVTYRVCAGGKWYAEVKNLTDYAGVEGKAITDVAIKVSKGSVKYRVHVKGGGWLGWITGYSTTDTSKYAGNGKPIDAIEVCYYTPADLVKTNGYYKAKYRVSPVNGGYYDYQYDNEKTGGQDGYAGSFGKSIDRLQITLSK